MAGWHRRGGHDQLNPCDNRKEGATVRSWEEHRDKCGVIERLFQRQSITKVQEKESFSPYHPAPCRDEKKNSQGQAILPALLAVKCFGLTVTKLLSISGGNDWEFAFMIWQFGGLCEWMKVGQETTQSIWRVSLYLLQLAPPRPLSSTLPSQDSLYFFI